MHHIICDMQVTYIDDNLHELSAALEAGFGFIGVETGLVTADNFKKVGAKSLSNIADLVQQHLSSHLLRRNAWYVKMIPGYINDRDLRIVSRGLRVNPSLSILNRTSWNPLFSMSTKNISYDTWLFITLY